MTIPGIHRIVAVHGAPRSGTSWLGQLLNSSGHVAYRYQPMFSYAFKGRLDTRSSATEVSGFFTDLLRTQDDFVLQRGKSSLSGYELAFPKQEITHLVYKEVRYHDLLENLLRCEPDMVGFGLVRNPCAVIHSWSRAPREFQSDWSLLGEWQGAPQKNRAGPENWYGYTRWKELAGLFQRLCDLFPHRFHIVRYEMLVADPEPALRGIFKHCDLPWSPQVAYFLRRTRTEDDLNPYGVFRSAAQEDSWRNKLDPAIIAEIHHDLHGGPLEHYLAPIASG